jgi:hypothetical protein
MKSKISQWITLEKIKGKFCPIISRNYKMNEIIKNAISGVFLIIFTLVLFALNEDDE